MIVLKGQRVSDGVAIGQCTVLSQSDVKVKEGYVTRERIEAEVRRFKKALKETEEDIRRLRDAQSSDLSDVRAIIDTHLSLLQDPNILGSIESHIRNQLYTAPYAVAQSIAYFAGRLKSIDNPMVSSKVADLYDVERRLLDHMLGGQIVQLAKLSRPLIIVGDDLTPTQAATLDRKNVLGFATERGSWASHTAILARALGIPAVVGVPGISQNVAVGATIIIDGFKGELIVDPDNATLQRYYKLRRQAKRKHTGDHVSKALKSETRDGETCELYGNIETKADIPRVIEFGGMGVGLFRTEFLFLGRQEPPDEEEQYEEYRQAAEMVGEGTLTIRSMDFGGDKFDKRVGELGEPNPFMGERAIRVSLKRRDLFRTQLRAILRAAVRGNVRLMFPMVMDVGEFRRVRACVDEAREELRKAHVKHAEKIALGTMVELPSAALNASRLADEVDFFSIGTNDLTQFCLGVDRTNHRVSSLFAPFHPAVARLIREVTRAAWRRQKSVTVCGEMAGDAFCAPLLLGLGVRGFSCSPPHIPGIKRTIRSVYLARCLDLAEHALRADDAQAVRELLETFASH